MKLTNDEQKHLRQPTTILVLFGPATVAENPGTGCMRSAGVGCAEFSLPAEAEGLE